MDLFVAIRLVAFFSVFFPLNFYANFPAVCQFVTLHPARPPPCHHRRWTGNTTVMLDGRFADRYLVVPDGESAAALFIRPL